MSFRFSAGQRVSELPGRATAGTTFEEGKLPDSLADEKLKLEASLQQSKQEDRRLITPTGWPASSPGLAVLGLPRENQPSKSSSTRKGL